MVVRSKIAKERWTSFMDVPLGNCKIFGVIHKMPNGGCNNLIILKIIQMFDMYTFKKGYKI